MTYKKLKKYLMTILLVSAMLFVSTMTAFAEDVVDPAVAEEGTGEDEFSEYEAELLNEEGPGENEVVITEIEETEVTETETSDEEDVDLGEDDVDTSIPKVAPEGTATIVEQIVEDENTNNQNQTE